MEKEGLPGMTEKITDITGLLEQAIVSSSKSKNVADVFNADNMIECEVEFDNNNDWYTLFHQNEIVGYMSTKYPAILLLGGCPNTIAEAITKMDVCNAFIDYDTFLECNPKILRKFISNPYLKLIDDRFLEDYERPFDYDAFDKIDSGIYYINPYRFKISDLISI